MDQTLEYISEKADKIEKEVKKDGWAKVSTCDYPNWDRKLHHLMPEIVNELESRGHRCKKAMTHGVSDWIFTFVHQPTPDLSNVPSQVLIKELRDRNYALSIWDADDVKMRAKDLEIELTDDEAEYIVKQVDQYHDATIGINWDVMDNYIFDAESDRC